MAIRGRKSKPASVKKATGNPGKRPIAKGVSLTGEPTAPAWFNKLEREEWDRIVPQLVTAGVIAEPHQGALEAICSLYASYRIARKKRAATEMRMASEAYRKALNEFGLTPASQGRVGGTGGNGNEDEADSFFTGPRAVNE